MKKLMAAFLLLVFLAGCASSQGGGSVAYEWMSKGNYPSYLNTPAHLVKIQFPSNAENKAKAQADLDHVNVILKQIERDFSITQTPIMAADGIEESLLMKVNRKSGIEPVVVNDDFLELIELALEIAEMTNGAFDPTIGPLARLWNISERSYVCDGLYIEPGDDYCDAPSPEAISEALALVDYRKIVMDRLAKTVYLPEAGMQLDLGGIAKGYAADKVIDFFKQEGYDSVILSLGGNIHSHGKDRINNVQFAVEIRDPFSVLWYNRIGGLRVDSVSVVTSGTYERYIVDDEGNVYHHLLDALTGYPFEGGLASVSVIAKSSAVADAMATGLFGLSREEGLTLVENIPNLDVVYITSDKNIYINPGLKFTYDTQLNDSGFVYHGENHKDDRLLYPNTPEPSTNPIVYIGVTVAVLGITMIGYAVVLSLKQKTRLKD
jgi:thiamine biosynthesis lipoprotein